MKQLSTDVLTALSTAQVEGQNVKLAGQFDRKLYLQVNEVLDRIGGKWNRKEKAHVFSEDPTDKLNAVIECGVLEPKVKTGYFPTPAALVAKMIELADVKQNHLILEPSAGQGHIADEICRTTGLNTNEMSICETLPENIIVLRKKGYVVEEFEFIRMAEEFKSNKMNFDRILMNPPFEKQQDIDHVTTAFNLLAEGGILVAIMSSGVLFRENKKTVTFRESILNKYADVVETNPEGSFKESGTMVNTVMVRLVKE